MRLSYKQCTNIGSFREIQMQERLEKKKNVGNSTDYFHQEMELPRDFIWNKLTKRMTVRL